MKLFELRVAHLYGRRMGKVFPGPKSAGSVDDIFAEHLEQFYRSSKVVKNRFISSLLSGKSAMPVM